MKTKGRNMNNEFLASENINKLIIRFAIPAIISGLIGAFYNIVDQYFIGNYVGMLGNAATNIAFPIITISTSLALLLGVGTSSNFSLYLGRGQENQAKEIIGNGISLMLSLSVILAVVGFIFLKPLLKLFGATEKVLPYAMEYTRIIIIGLPFFIFSNAVSHVIRADGSPIFAMVSIAFGGILNILLDALFIIRFKMGMTGAALATIIGQIISSMLSTYYLFNFKTIKIELKDFKVGFNNFKAIISLGASACFNQLALTLYQITMNNTLKKYGALSKYGSDIPIAVVGVISKVFVLFISVVVGISQGSQPIFGYNYGAENYERVKKTFIKALKAILIFSMICFFIFQIFPRQILGFFSDGGKDQDLYFEFGVNYFRIFLFMIFLNGIQPLTGNFFSAIGKAKKGIFVSMTRQIIFLVPLIIILPKFLGINGIMYAGPIADLISAVLAIFLVVREFRIIDELEAGKQ